MPTPSPTPMETDTDAAADSPAPTRRASKRKSAASAAVVPAPSTPAAAEPSTATPTSKRARSSSSNVSASKLKRAQSMRATNNTADANDEDGDEVKGNRPSARRAKSLGSAKSSSGKKKQKAPSTMSQDDCEDNDDVGGDESAAISRTTSSAGFSPIAAELAVIEQQKRANRPPGSITICSWNVNGLRAALRSGAASYFNEVDADIIALSEVKADEETIKNEFDQLGEESNTDLSSPSSSVASSPLAAAFAGKKLTKPPQKYHKYFNCCMNKKGYSGTAILSKVKPLSVTKGIGVAEHDEEGRVLTAEYPSFFLVLVYVPNAGQKLERLSYRTQKWDTAFQAYLAQLSDKKPVVWTGDLNVAWRECDIHSPKTNQRSAGFTMEERTNFAKIVQVHPEKGWPQDAPTIEKDVDNNNNHDSTSTAHPTQSATTSSASSSSPSPDPPTSFPSSSSSPPSSASSTLRWIDAFDRLNPDAPASHRFTYWSHRFSARSKHKGWRLDYFMVHPSLWPNVVDTWIGCEMSAVDGTGARRSDHAPIFLNLTSL